MIRRVSVVRGGRDFAVSVGLHQCVTQMQRSLQRKLEALSRNVTPVTVHACRTQMRRLRALLRAFKHAFNLAALARYEKVLRRLTHDLSPVRSADVEEQVISRLSEEQYIPKVDGMQQLLALAAQTRSRAVGDLKAKMNVKAWLRRLERLRRAASDPKLVLESRLPMALMTARILMRRRRRLRRRLRASKPSPRALHKVRLEVKALRYLLECCAPDEVAIQAEFKQLVLLQDRLGEFRDDWSVRRELKHQPRHLRANLDVCAALRSRRGELLRSIEKHGRRLLGIWKKSATGELRRVAI